MEANFDIQKIQFKFEIKEGDSMLAQFEIFYDDLHIRGYRIMKSSKDMDNPYYVQPPASSNKFGGWIDIVKIENKNKWFEFCSLAIEKYKEAKEEADIELAEEDIEGIDPDDLPF